jgi:hypothetical protein
MNTTFKAIYDSFVGLGTTAQDVAASAEMIRVGIATDGGSSGSFVTLPTAESIISAIKEG